MSSVLIRKRQAGIKLEATEGTAESLAAADFSGERKAEAESYDLGTYERTSDRASLTKRPILGGGTKALTLKWEEECVGGDASTLAPWHVSLQAMGFTATGLKVISLTGAPTGGSFVAGQTIGNNTTEGSATKKGVFVCYINGATKKIVYRPTVGAFANTDVISNYATSQVSATASGAPSAAGFAFRPLTYVDDSTKPPSATAELRYGGLRHTVVGGRGKGSLMLEVNKPAMLQVEITGPGATDSANGDRPYAASEVANVPAIAARPIVSKGLPFVLNSGGSDYTPVLTKGEVVFDNTLAARKTISNTDTANSGCLPTLITDRSIMLKFDPERSSPGGAIDFDRLESERGLFSAYSSSGTPAGASGMLILSLPKLTVSGQSGRGDREGLATLDVSALATGDSDDEIEIWNVFVP